MKKKQKIKAKSHIHFFFARKASAMPPKKMYIAPFRQNQPHQYQRMR
jgi:hypothetical protein